MTARIPRLALVRGAWLALLGAALTLAMAPAAARAEGDAGWSDGHMRSRVGGASAPRKAAPILGSSLYGQLAAESEPFPTGVVEQTLETRSQHAWSQRVLSFAPAAAPEVRRGSRATRHRGTPGGRSTAAPQGSQLGSTRRATGGR